MKAATLPSPVGLQPCSSAFGSSSSNRLLIQQQQCKGLPLSLPASGRACLTGCGNGRATRVEALGSFEGMNKTVKINRTRGGAGSSGRATRVLQVLERSPPQQQQQQVTTLSRSPSGSYDVSQPSAPAAQQHDDHHNLSGIRWWDALPARSRIVFGAAMAFVICNMDKVNLSVAIIPMAHEFGWSPSVAGLVQSAFFWGYMICQLPGGYLTSSIGGRRVLPTGVLLWSAATAAVPWAAATIPSLCLSRAVVGFGEATAPSSATDIIARSVPASERARAVTFTFAGLHVGSIVGLLAAPWLSANFGWRSIFLTFGALGLVWYYWFEQGVMAPIARAEPELQERLTSNSRATSTATAAIGASASSGSAATGATPADPPPVPWRAFLRSTPLRALMYTHFANNWFHYTMLAWLPTYFVDTLSVDLMHASQTALLPPLAGIAASVVAGQTADTLISRGMSVTGARKLCQNIAFLLPTACLLAASFWPAIGESNEATVAAITVSLGISSFSLAGLFCTHQDMSPKYAPILLGLTNTTAAIPGVLGVASVGFLLEQLHSWELALFVPSAFFMVTAAAAYTVFGCNEPVNFDAADNSPFAWEAAANSARERLHRLRAHLSLPFSHLRNLPGLPGLPPFAKLPVLAEEQQEQVQERGKDRQQ